MKVIVKAVEVKKVYRTYCVDGVNSLESAEKCVQRCYNHEYQPNTYQMREYGEVPQLIVDSYEVVEE